MANGTPADDEARLILFVHGADRTELDYVVAEAMVEAFDLSKLYVFMPVQDDHEPPEGGS